MTPPEFSRLVPLDQVGTAATALDLDATETEREALAKRFGLLALERLDAKLELQRDGKAFRLSGRFGADVVQACIATAEPVASSLEDSVAIRFAPPEDLAPDAEVELSDADCDTVELEGQAIDVGEAIAQSLALALNPYPRSPSADATLRAAGIKREEEAGAFAGLAALRDRLMKPDA